MCQTIEKDSAPLPQAREPSKCLNGQSNRGRLAKEAFWPPATRGLKKDYDRAITPVVEAICVPAALVPPGSPQPKQLLHFMLNPQWGRTAIGKKCLVSMHEGCFSRVQLFATLGAVAWQASLSVGFSKQEYWSVLANTGCHTLLEHYISCYPSHQLPWVPGLPDPCDPSSCTTSTPGPHWGRPMSSRTASGANRSGWPTGRDGNKTRIKTQAQCG